MLPERFALIIGAMKCGTTSLYDHLVTHPEVAACREKEPDFFCSDDFRPEDFDRYRALWKWEPERHRIALEASVSYTKQPRFPDCAERIARCDGADFRFVYCMRHPLERIESHVYHGAYHGWTPALDEGVSEHALNVSRYAMQLDPFAARFGRARLHLIVLEELRRAPAEGMRRLCEFLEIDPGFRFEDLEEAHNAASDHFLERPVWSRLRGVPGLRAAARLVPARARRSLRRATGTRLDVRRKLTPEERARALSLLEPDLVRLRSSYGIDAEQVWGIPLP